MTAALTARLAVHRQHHLGADRGLGRSEAVATGSGRSSTLDAGLLQGDPEAVERGPHVRAAGDGEDPPCQSGGKR
eukprot:scaffold4702_cov105-Pinguiococcus_pyrenoidosus.AAC.1